MPKKNEEEDTSCSVTMRSKKDPSHTHTCVGKHANAYHYCSECREWWGKKGT